MSVCLLMKTAEVTENGLTTSMDELFRLEKSETFDTVRLTLVE